MSRLERWLYRDMLDIYYDTERPLPIDVEKLLNDLGTKTDEESTAVQRLLRFKFEKTDDGYRHIRCDEEIANYHDKGKQASLAGKASAAARMLNKSSTTVQRPFNDRSTEINGLSTNQEPITKNHKPNKVKNTAPVGAEIDTEFETAWKAYPKRPGMSKTDSLKAWKARMKAGDLPSSIIQGTLRYASYVTAMGIEPQFIKQPATFFGPGLHFLADWTAMPVKASGGAWWATDESILAKASELGIKSLPGETTSSLKGRIQAAICNGGKPVAAIESQSKITKLPPELPRGEKPTGLNLKSLVKTVSQ